jgi:hypothetical protein
MMHAYSELYRDTAARAFGEMMDYAVNGCGIDGNAFLFQFIISGIALHFEQGQSDLLAGHSGIELARLMFSSEGRKEDSFPQSF